MEEKKHAENVRHELSIMSKHYGMLHYAVQKDYQELEAKII